MNDDSCYFNNKPEQKVLSYYIMYSVLVLFLPILLVVVSFEALKINVVSL